MANFRITAPVGLNVVPKEVLNEKELRDFAAQLVQEAHEADVWREKVEKDTIEEVVDWLRAAGYEVEPEN